MSASHFALLRGWTLAAAMVISSVGSASAEATQVRIGETYGLTHLPSYVMVDEHFIEKRAKQLGLGDVAVSATRVSSGPVVNDLLLSNNIDVAMVGLIPFLTLWDKTQGKVRGIGALSEANVFLFSTDPHIKSIKDYGPNDRIAMTDVKATTWAILLQMEAAKVYGWDQRSKFDPLMVGMSNGDATAAMLSGRTEVKSHMTMLPFSAIERSNDQIHTILGSREILGHPYTTTVAVTSEKFHTENPKLYLAITQALDDAIAFIKANPDEAADIYNRHEPQKGGVAAVESMMKPGQDGLAFTTTPNSAQAFADFMFKSGSLQNHPKSWKELFFDNIWKARGT